MSCIIRKATEQDLTRAREIYGIARNFMRDNGNLTQWGEGDEPENLTEDDIRQGNLYALTDNAGEIHAVFVFMIGEDPTYLKIDRGTGYQLSHMASYTEWQVTEAFMVFWDGSCITAKDQMPASQDRTHMRINKVMQHVIEKCGFVRCGIIYVSDGTPRIAYECR